MSAAAHPTVIVLAAGHGRRFGEAGHKLTQSLGSSTVLASTLSQVVASGLPLVVVTTDSLAPLAKEHVAACDVVTVSQADLGEGFGMGRSIAAGVQARASSPGWIVMPGDMPLVRAHTIAVVARALEDHVVACAHHRGQRGHPVGFSSELYSELASLSGDEGARRIVARYPMSPIEVTDGGVLMDIDTADDLQLARAYHAAHVGDGLVDASAPRLAG
jgi:molybdenum cofactor cytidylyltransferase